MQEPAQRHLKIEILTHQLGYINNKKVYHKKANHSP